MITSVVFDVGETLLDDTREFGAWADWLGVPRHTFSAVLGAVTAQGRDNAETFEYFHDLVVEPQRREDAGRGELIGEDDLYPDVRPVLAELQARGLWVGVAGNQTARAAGLLRGLGLPVDAIATSGEWGVAKPAPAFFDKVAAFAPGPRSEIAYVGDHRDNDIVPAHRAGLRAVFLRRGPWGHLWADDPTIAEAARLADRVAGRAPRPAPTARLGGEVRQPDPAVVRPLPPDVGPVEQVVDDVGEPVELTIGAVTDVRGPQDVVGVHLE